MGKGRPKLKSDLIEQLIQEAAGKCANPGCANRLVVFHHIKQWHICKTHDKAQMIAICGACHEAIHRGRLEISDETLLRWKSSFKPLAPGTFTLHIDPAATPKLMLGSFCVATDNSQLIVIDFASNNRLSMRLLDSSSGGRTLQVSLIVQKLNGEEVLRVTDNVVFLPAGAGVEFESRPGKVRVTVPATDEYVPQFAFTQMRSQVPSFALDGRLILDIEVMDRGLMRVQGFWPSKAGAVFIITDQQLSYCAPGLRGPISLTGGGGHRFSVGGTCECRPVSISRRRYNPGNRRRRCGARSTHTRSGIAGHGVILPPLTFSPPPAALGTGTAGRCCK